MICPDTACGGTVEDGYCSLCGIAVRGAAPAVPTAASTPTSGPATTAGSRRNLLGAGLVEVPTVASTDPAAAVMVDPTVVEGRRYCTRCDHPVGRSRDGQPGRVEGYCRSCGARFSFRARLAAGDVVGGQYEVAGCLAHGGLGWIYLARDHKVSDRWVVLKGLLDSGNDDAVAAALAERRFLAEVEHPNIVKIHNFVEHGTDGYIVMEFVNGVSLRAMLEARRAANGGRVDPLPVEQAMAYCLEILPALGHLHDLGLAYCDFKPDNVIQVGASVKLIDLGGVYQMDDDSSPIYGTVGYQAPEIAETGPTVASDLFTVGRTLAVLSIDFPGYQSSHRFDLPSPGEVELFARFDSLYAFLLRATAADPARRFASAEEMAGQLVGVLREVVAATTGEPAPGPSQRFTPTGRGTQQPDWRALPSPLLDADDPHAALIVSLAAAGADEVIDSLEPMRGESVEIDLWLSRALIERERFGRATEILERLATDRPGERRTSWYRGVVAFATGELARAGEDFTAVYRWLPGELAPKLALGMVAEAAGDQTTAARWYEIVSRTDRGVTSAAFGLGRCLTRLGQARLAASAYRRVADTSSDHLEAWIAEVRLLLGGAVDGGQPVADVVRAAAIVEHADLAPAQRARLAVDVLDTAVRTIGADVASPNATILGHRAVERDLRLGLESALRELARHTTDKPERIRVVERANRIRPLSLL